MAVYFHLFNTQEEFNNARTGSGYTEPWISAIKEQKGAAYNKTEAEKPLTITFHEAGEFKWRARLQTKTISEVARTIEYSINGGEWISITATSDNGGVAVSVSSGDVVTFRGSNPTLGLALNDNCVFTGITAQCDISGNIMSLLNPTGYSEMKTFASAFPFTLIFRNNTGIVDASKLALPATGLTERCYSYMFYGCTGLVHGPDFPPVLNVARQCYHSMFCGCSNLISGPKQIGLPDSTIGENACGDMYNGCTSLTTAPLLPAKTMGNNCYEQMFQGCSSLNYVRCGAEYLMGTNNWLQGVAENGTFAAKSNVEWVSGPSGIPTGWTRVSY